MAEVIELEEDEVSATRHSGMCIICDKYTDESVYYLARGTDAFLDQCDSLQLYHIRQYVNSHQQEKVGVHTTCRTDLRNKARKRKQPSADEPSTAKRPTRASTATFDFKLCCFFCAESIAESKPDKARKVVTLDMQEKVKAAIVARNDDWSVAVNSRIQQVVDLPAVDAVYHQDCRDRFIRLLPHTPHKVPRGRPVKEKAHRAFELLCEQIEKEGENDLYTLRDLHEKMCNIAEIADDSSVYTREHLRNLLKKRYGEHIYFISKLGREDVVGFKQFCDLIMREKFFGDRAEGFGSDAERVVMKAASLILAEIRETEFERNSYPTADEISEPEGLKFVPSLLRIFIQKLLQQRKPVKQAGLAQALVQSARPKGCLMPLPFAVGVELEKSGNKQLHDKMAHLGFSVSYAETRRFKQSVMQHVGNVDRDQTVESTDSTFVQYVADNVDHNIKTLDGRGTFHGMGIISTTVRTHDKQTMHQTRVPRCKPMLATEAIRDKTVPIIRLSGLSAGKLEGVQLAEIRSLRQPLVLPPLLAVNSIWHFSGLHSPSFQPRPNWSGYMQSVSTGDHPCVCAVDMLSVVDLNPSDENCIHSTLLFVIQHARDHGVPSPCITFDQPLFIKATDIAMKENLDIVVRLGGFHTLMSFMGSIGHVMRGSGFEEVLRVIYGEQTIEHVLSGKAYNRAIRAHFLTQAVLVELLIKYLSSPLVDDDTEHAVVLSSDSACQLVNCFNQELLHDLETLYQRTIEDKVCTSDSYILESVSIQFVNQKLEELQLTLSEQSRTARLWIQYIKYVDIIKTFLLAERTGNWLLHLDTLQRMLPLFAATGHGNYAKSARMYLQQMNSLPKTHPWLYKQFMEGNHTARRSDRLWAGLSTDLVIEQTMMRSIKSQGGLTHGRGMTETVRTTWLSTITECSVIHAALSKVTKTETAVNDHVDNSKARMNRDYKDRQLLSDHLKRRSPFCFQDCDRLISLSSGVAAGKEDDVNCDDAEAVGYRIHELWDSMPYGNLTLKKCQRVKTLADLLQSTSDNKLKLNLHPLTLFGRLLLVAERKTMVSQCFAFELTQYPMSLFKDFVMRKPNKPDLYLKFAKNLMNCPLPSELVYVVDGGYLLHRVRWQAPANMCGTLPQYLQYLRKLGRPVRVVFDGYSNGPSTKDQEHVRRVGKSTSMAPTRKLSNDSTQLGSQEAFLANTENKAQFITLLMKYLHEAGIHVQQAVGDADTSIVQEALECARQFNNPVAVLAEDTDVLALLVYHKKDTMQEIYFVSQGKHGGGKIVGAKSISVTAVQTKLGPECCKRLLVAHAFGGCDTTSAIYGHGKGRIVTLLNNKAQLSPHCDILQSATSSVEQVDHAGIQLMKAVYGGTATDKLPGMRYTSYCTMTLSKHLQPERLPPTENAAAMHARRTHHQAVTWGTLGTTTLPPTEWGWKLASERLVPIQTLDEVAPEEVRRVVICNCKGDCDTNRCSCRKNGLQCCSACKKCKGTSCTNAKVDLTDDDNDTNAAASASTNVQSKDMPDCLWEDGLYLDVLFEEEV